MDNTNRVSSRYRDNSRQRHRRFSRDTSSTRMPGSSQASLSRSVSRSLSRSSHRSPHRSTSGSSQIYTQVLQTQTIPKIKLCTHWLFRGSCSYISNPGGCRLPHAMPSEDGDLHMYGLSIYPKWFIDSDPRVQSELLDRYIRLCAVEDNKIEEYRSRIADLEDRINTMQDQSKFQIDKLVQVVNFSLTMQRATHRYFSSLPNSTDSIPRFNDIDEELRDLFSKSLTNIDVQVVSTEDVSRLLDNLYRQHISISDATPTQIKFEDLY